MEKHYTAFDLPANALGHIMNNALGRQKIIIG
jgi:hypothetical protein